MLIGVWLGQFTPPVFLWVNIAAAGLIVGAFRSRRWYACLVLIVAGGLLGISRGSWFAQDLQRLDSYVGKTATIEGVFSQDPVQQGESNVWKGQLGYIRIGAVHYSGEIYATILSDTSLSRGDRVTVHSKVGSGFGSFQLSMYRAEMLKVQHSDDVFVRFRDSFAAAIRTVTPEPEASLGVGFLVGQKSALPQDFEEQLKIVGLTHLVVASGYNLTILVRFARRLLARRSRYLALAGSLVLIVAFIGISGMSPSMLRAATVTILSLLAWYYGRRFHPVQLIVLVAALSAYAYPVYVWSDLGWALSFAAFTGILVVAPIILGSFRRLVGTTGSFVQLLVETLSAEIMTLPLIMVVFGYIPTYALLANMLVAPLVPFVMGASLLAGIAGMVGSAFVLFAMPAAVSAAFIVAVVEWLSALPGSEISLGAGAEFAWWWFVCLGLFFVWLWKRNNIQLEVSSVTE